MDVRKIYQQRRDRFHQEAVNRSNLANRISIFRISVFLLGLISIIYFANLKQFTPIVIIFLITLVVFVWLVKYYNRVSFQRNHANFLSQINESAIKKTQVDLKDFDPGDEFKNQAHSYSNDLDIFGRNSLFQLINFTTTASGREKLAKYLQQPFLPEEIKNYQLSSQELSADPDWIQEFHALGLHYQEKENYNDSFFEWINGENLIKNKAFNFIISNVFSLIALAVVTSWFFVGFSFSYVLLVLVVNSLIIYAYNNKLQATTEKTDESGKALAAYEMLIEKLENSSFSSEKLKQLQAQFMNQELKASRTIKKLKDIVYLLSSRSNMFYWLINVMLMLDLRLLRMAEDWKTRGRKYIVNWFDTVNEIEYINSLAAFAHAHPDYHFAEVLSVNEEIRIQADNLGHPLIKPDARVCNDFKITNKANIILVTGSNMAGKSTFLRTVGINMVLAQMGAPVCAASFYSIPFQVFTSMRTQDNLEENVSSFYAELQRISQLLELIPESNVPVFFMLDELLKGTNSQDRHKGAMALVTQLHEMNITGIVSTHDLELAILEQNLQKVENFSFESYLHEGELKFDYKIHKGITESFNASILMQKMGIQVDKYSGDKKGSS